MGHAIPAKKLIEAVEENGFHEARVKGDHHQYKKDGHPGLVTIAFSSKKDDIPPGTAKSILHQAGLDHLFGPLTGHHAPKSSQSGGHRPSFS